MIIVMLACRVSGKISGDELGRSGCGVGGGCLTGWLSGYS